MATSPTNFYHCQPSFLCYSVKPCIRRISTFKVGSTNSSSLSLSLSLWPFHLSLISSLRLGFCLLEGGGGVPALLPPQELLLSLFSPSSSFFFFLFPFFAGLFSVASLLPVSPPALPLSLIARWLLSLVSLVRPNCEVWVGGCWGKVCDVLPPISALRGVFRSGLTASGDITACILGRQWN